MFPIDNSTAASVLPAPAAQGTPGFFTNGSPAGGVPATILEADWLNMVQQELLSVLAAANITPSKTTYNQLLAAITSLPVGRLVGIQVFPASGTYIRSPGAKSGIVEGVGGGAGGGGCPAPNSSQQATAGGGMCGAYARAYFSTLPATAVVTIGTAGAGGAAGANPGVAGGSTSFGSLLNIPGGYGGSAGSVSAATIGAFGSSVGAAPTVSGGGILLGQNNACTGAGPIVLALNQILSGTGGDSPWGRGGRPVTGLPGTSATGYGAGGGGCSQTPGENGSAGGSGSPAFLAVFEFSGGN